jgi:NAD-dependent dihydropyrimidine dehydrogenase PreA subunit
VLVMPAGRCQMTAAARIGHCDGCDSMQPTRPYLVERRDGAPLPADESTAHYCADCATIAALPDGASYGAVAGSEVRIIPEHVFTVIEADGRTRSRNPKKEAYQYAALLQRQGFHTSMTFADGEISVAAPGLMTITFYAEGAK